MAVRNNRRNIIVFGETGSGKSSLINLIAGEGVASTSSSAKGCTFESFCHQVDIPQGSFNIWDTVGLNEGSMGTVDAKRAIACLYKLIEDLADGVSLLILCMRAPRITQSTERNYALFCRALCQEKVPTVIAVTGLENELPMDKWWDNNRSHFEGYKMEFDAHACITATRGPNDRLLQEYIESQLKIRDLMQYACKDHPWKMPHKRWFELAANKFRGLFKKWFGLQLAVGSNFVDDLVRFVKLPRTEALEIWFMIKSMR